MGYTQAVEALRADRFDKIDLGRFADEVRRLEDWERADLAPYLKGVYAWHLMSCLGVDVSVALPLLAGDALSFREFEPDKANGNPGDAIFYLALPSLPFDEAEGAVERALTMCERAIEALIYAAELYVISVFPGERSDGLVWAVLDLVLGRQLLVASSDEAWPETGDGPWSLYAHRAITEAMAGLIGDATEGEITALQRRLSKHRLELQVIWPWDGVRGHADIYQIAVSLTKLAQSMRSAAAHRLEHRKRVVLPLLKQRLTADATLAWLPGYQPPHGSSEQE